MSPLWTKERPDYDLLAVEATQDPYPLFDRMRRDDPVHWSGRHGTWILTRYEHVSAAFRDPRFSSDRLGGYRKAKLSDAGADPRLGAAFDVLSDWMVFKDGADHTRLRRLVRQAFAPRAIGRLRESIAEQTGELISGFQDRGSADMVDDFALELTAGTICDMLGAPRSDRGLFRLWSTHLSTLLSGARADDEHNAKAASGTTDMADYIAGLVDKYTDRPAENLVSYLIEAGDADDALSHSELVSTCVLLLFAGHETTTSLISSFVLSLLKDTESLAQIVEGTADIDSATEELIRFEGPVQGDIRILTEDVELDGRKLSAGSRVLLLISAANRDPEVFDHPNRLDFGRDKIGHLGFGIGAHYCLGAPLARLEATIAVPALISRLPTIRLAGEARWHSSLLSRSLGTLPTTWDTP
ncbi:cytochrome P450 [Mycobacterium syngnathidarum]